MAAKATNVETIRRGKIYEEVARRIERLIGQELKPGDKLPSERRLTELFGVSRSSIRDAIRSLELLGIVEPRQGAGTVVRESHNNVALISISTELMRKRKSVSELLDVRKMIEPPLAARAAVNATNEELDEMKEVLRRQEEKVRRHVLAIDEDNEFHYCIALAANNSIVLKVLDLLMDMLRETRERSLQVPGRLQRSFVGHRRIMNALEQRDANAAEAAMRAHINEIEEMVLKKL